MTQFNVGDIVTGTQIATERYSMTIRGVKMRVVGVLEDILSVKLVGIDEDMVVSSLREKGLPQRRIDNRIADIVRDVQYGRCYSVTSALLNCIKNNHSTLT